MKLRQQLCLLSVVILWSFNVIASDRSTLPTETTQQDCDRLLAQQKPTLSQLNALAKKDQHQRRATLPARTFIDPIADQSRVEQGGAEAPRALQELLPPNMFFQTLQANNPESDSVIRLDSPDKSVVHRLEVPFNGTTIATSVYASIPSRIKNSEAVPDRGPYKRPYLIGPEHKDTGVIFWMHGGGTPTATGVNAMSVGLELGKRKVPVVAIDLPGHGNSSIYPFKSGKEIIEYLLVVMGITIHPDVKVIWAGHSWGGQFAIQTYLLWPELNTANTNIVGFLSLAPPADLSLGGCAAEKIAAEKDIEARYRDFKDSIAEGDFDFIENTVRNGKTSPVAGMMCTISALDYSWKLPTDNKPRPHLMVMVGQNDGLVYTGREEPFNKFLIPLIGAENFIVLPPGKTFKGERKTGHNIFDLYMNAQNRAELKDFLGDEANKESVAEVYTRIGHYVSKRIGMPLPKTQNEDPEQIIPRINEKWGIPSVAIARKELPISKTEARTQELVRFLEVAKPIQQKILAENPDTTAEQIRALLSRPQDVLNLETARLELEKRDLAKDRRRALEAFVLDARAILSEYKKKTDTQIHTAILIATQLPQGIESIADAEWELGLDTSEARKTALRRYINEIEQTESDTSVTGLIDRAYRHFANNLAFREFIKLYIYRDFEATPQATQTRVQLERLENFIAIVEGAKTRAQKDAQIEIDQTIQATGEKWATSSVANARKELPIVKTDARTKELSLFLDVALVIRQKIQTENPDTTAEQIKNLPSRPKDVLSLEAAQAEIERREISKERRKNLEAFILNARTILNEYKKKMGAKINTAILAATQFPKDVKSISDAEWELGLDTSETRKTALRRYLGEVEQIEKTLPQLVKKKEADAFIGLTVPEEFKGRFTNRSHPDQIQAAYQMAQVESKKMRDILDSRYSVEPVGHEKSSRGTAYFIQRKDNTAEALNQGNREIRAAVNRVTDLRKKRIDLKKAFASALDEAIPPALVSYTLEREQSFDDYEHAKAALEKATEDKATPEQLVQLKINQDQAWAKFQANKVLAQNAAHGVHPEIIQALNQRELALVVFTRTNRSYDLFIAKNLTQQYDAGTLSNERVQQIFAETRSHAEAFKRARGTFLQANYRLEKLTLKLAEEGQLGQQIKELANQLHGRDGLDKQLQQAMTTRDNLLMIQTSLQAEALALRKKYNELVPGYFEHREQNLYSLLNLSYDDLVKRLNDPSHGPLAVETLRSALKEFDDLWRGRDVPEKKGADIN